MNRRAAGIHLLGIAAFLFAARYLAAAIFGSGVDSWNRDLFQAMLQYVGSELLVLSALAGAAGLAYLLWAELKDRASTD